MRNIFTFILINFILINQVVFAASTASCYDLADTVYMLHGDGTDASTTIIDEAGHSTTTAGNAQIDTAQKKFGTASILFDGTGDYTTTPDSTDFDLAGGDFTIEMWIRFSTLVNVFIVGQDEGGGSKDKWIVQWNAASASAEVIKFFWTVEGGSSTTVVSSANAVPSVNTWYHLSVVRNGNNWHFFLDGTQVGTTQVQSGTIPDVTFALQVGSQEGILEHNGWVDELRIIKGFALWTANFTPPASAYTNCADFKPRIVVVQ